MFAQSQWDVSTQRIITIKGEIRAFSPTSVTLKLDEKSKTLVGPVHGDGFGPVGAAEPEFGKNIPTYIKINADTRMQKLIDKATVPASVSDLAKGNFAEVQLKSYKTFTRDVAESILILSKASGATKAGRSVMVDGLCDPTEEQDEWLPFKVPVYTSPEPKPVGDFGHRRRYAK